MMAVLKHFFDRRNAVVTYKIVKIQFQTSIGRFGIKLLRVSNLFTNFG